MQALSWVRSEETRRSNRLGFLLRRRDGDLLTRFVSCDTILASALFIPGWRGQFQHRHIIPINLQIKKSSSDICQSDFVTDT
jgi:hypothetical protein